MTDKELRRLSRTDLLEMLLEQSKEVERLQQELAEARQQLQDRRIMTEEAGSIAEAALRINRVFEAAQAAADLCGHCRGIYPVGIAPPCLPFKRLLALRPWLAPGLLFSVFVFSMIIHEKQFVNIIRAFGARFMQSRNCFV